MSCQGKEAQEAFVHPKIPATAIFSKLIMFQYFTELSVNTKVDVSIFVCPQ